MITTVYYKLREKVPFHRQMLAPYADFWALSATGRVPVLCPWINTWPCMCSCSLLVLPPVSFDISNMIDGWYCHMSGGTDVVGLPEVLLPDAVKV